MEILWNPFKKRVRLYRGVHSTLWQVHLWFLFLASAWLCFGGGLEMMQRWGKFFETKPLSQQHVWENWSTKVLVDSTNWWYQWYLKPECSYHVPTKVFLQCTKASPLWWGLPCQRSNSHMVTLILGSWTEMRCPGRILETEGHLKPWKHMNSLYWIFCPVGEFIDGITDCAVCACMNFVANWQLALINTPKHRAVGICFTVRWLG